MPLDNPEVLEAAQRHARARFEQGLTAADVVMEFRVLRQEIGRALRDHVPDEAPAGDVIAAELLVHDALDGATALALAALGRELEELREDVLAMTVHDVRQPMASLKARLQYATRLLVSATPNVEHALTLLRQADQELDRLSGLLAGLSEASRAAVGRLELHPTSADMRDLVRAALDRLDPETAVRCRFRAGEEVITTGRWDPQLIERVLDNLILNAAKYSDGDSVINIELDGEDNSVHVVVRDHGLGVTDEELQQLFRRYTRTRRAVDMGTHGAGLGLYVCKGIIDAHGGRIWAESDGVGKGSAFHIALPRN